MVIAAVVVGPRISRRGAEQIADNLSRPALLPRNVVARWAGAHYRKRALW